MVDFDFVNCHYVILNYYCELNNLPREQIKYYVENRDKVLYSLIEHYKNKLSRSTVKTELIKILNGGNAFNLNDLWTNDLKKEMIEIHNFAVKERPADFAHAKSIKKTSPHGSVLNKIMCEYERNALQAKCEFAISYNFEPSVLMFDGSLCDNINNVIVDNDFLKLCSDYVLLKTDIPLNVVSKPIKRLDLTGLKTKLMIAEEAKDDKQKAKEAEIKEQNLIKAEEKKVKDKEKADAKKIKDQKILDEREVKNKEKADSKVIKDLDQADEQEVKDKKKANDKVIKDKKKADDQEVKDKKKVDDQEVKDKKLFEKETEKANKLRRNETLKKAKIEERLAKKDEKKKDIIWSENALDVFENKIFMIDGSILIIYDEEFGIWTDNEIMIRKCFMLNANIIFTSTSEGDDNLMFNSCYKNTIDNVKASSPRITNQLFYNNKDIGYLLFLNGVLNMETFEMVEFSPDFRFTQHIKRKFDVTIDYTEGISDLYSRLFHKQFNKVTNLDTLNYYLYRYARAIAGKYTDREFGICLGETACGKTAWTGLLSMTFEDFVTEFNAEEFVVKNMTNSDVDRGFSFILKIYNKRIAISNDVVMKPGCKLNGTLLKKTVSAGDGFDARKLYIKKVLKLLINHLLL